LVVRMAVRKSYKGLQKIFLNDNLHIIALERNHMEHKTK
jgi:hypothetical protein